MEIAVDVGGWGELTELIDAVNTNDLTIHIADESGHVHVVSPLLPNGNIKGEPVQYCTYHQRGYREC